MPATRDLIIAHGESRAAPQARIAADPVLANGIATADACAIAARRIVPAPAAPRVTA